MEIAEIFGQMKLECERWIHDRSAKETLKQRLEYFRLQALCDFDRVDNPQKIARAWAEFLSAAKPSGVLHHLARDKARWAKVTVFAGKGSFIEPPTPVKQVSSQRNWDVDRFFDYLLTTARFKKFESREELLKIQVALSYLCLEAKAPRQKRNRNLIKQTWLWIWPILKRVDLLSEFDGDQSVQTRLRFFIEDKF